MSRRTITTTDTIRVPSDDKCHEIAYQMIETLHYLHKNKKPPIQVLRKALDTAHQLKGKGNSCEYVISKVLEAYKKTNISETDIENVRNAANRQIREDNCKEIMSSLKMSLNANIFKSNPINLTHQMSAFDITKCDKYFQLKQRKEISDIQIYKIEKSNDKLFTHFSWKLNKKSKMLYFVLA